MQARAWRKSSVAASLELPEIYKPLGSSLEPDGSIPGAMEPMAAAQAGQDVQERVDVEEHERRAALFWAVCSLLVAIFTAAAAPNTKIMQPGGIVFFVSYFAANLIYA